MEREPDIDAARELAGRPVPAVDSRELGAIFAGGFLGAVGRAGLTQALAAAPGSWPWATFAVNMAAAALLGFAVTWLGEHRGRTLYSRAFLATGVCGALSTFSTVMVELVRLQERAGWLLALGYGVASLAGGLAAVLIGVKLAGGRSAPDGAVE